MVQDFGYSRNNGKPLLAIDSLIAATPSYMISWLLQEIPMIWKVQCRCV